jgi:calcineurin-like phosphoesterase family protein
LNGHRQFETVEQMNERIIQNWNAVVSDNDDIFFLGDLSFAGSAKTVDVVGQLKGRKHWILGNHDKGWAKKSAVNMFFHTREHYMEIDVLDTEVKNGKQRIILSHYPYLVWNKAHYGSWMLHGHSHGNCKYPKNRMRILDVGTDTNDFHPYSYSEIKLRMKTRRFVSFDHHTEREEE